MAAVLFVAATLATRDQIVRMRRQQIEAEIQGIARALAEYRHKHRSGWQCRFTLPDDQSAPGSQVHRLIDGRGAQTDPGESSGRGNGDQRRGSKRTVPVVPDPGIEFSHGAFPLIHRKGLLLQQRE
jgi:hypothetical protein